MLFPKEGVIKKVDNEKEYYWLDEFGGVNGPDLWSSLQELRVQNVISDDTEICAVGDKIWTTYKNPFGSPKSSSEGNKNLDNELVEVSSVRQQASGQQTNKGAPTSVIHLVCPSCKKTIEFSKEMAGQTGKCPYCDQSIIIPDTPIEQPAPATKQIKPTTSRYICSNCGSYTNGTSHTKGYFVLEIILWLCWVIPGLLYTMWRLTTRGKVCHLCKCDTLTPVNSPMGRKLQKEFQSKQLW
ncbi:MAG: hypothetical protein WC340_12000 [Kiritimatiellia bacterium]